MIKPVRPWKWNEECPLGGFVEFKEELVQASYHNAAERSGEMKLARERVRAAAKIAIDRGWPYWVMERMFKEIGPLVDWVSFMNAYIDLLHNNYHNGDAV